MKHLKKFENLKEENIKRGDYITINNTYYNNQIYLNCLKVTHEPHYNNTFDTERMVTVEYITNDMVLDKSYLFISQIGDYASQKDIDIFESMIDAKKYNL